MSQVFKVHFLSTNLHSCFFYLNESDLRNFKFNGGAIKIQFGSDRQNITYGSINLTPLTEVPNKHIGISSLCAIKLGLQENEMVTVTQCDVNSIDRLQLIPRREEDYVILLSCKSILEMYLLNQVSVVAEGQVLPLYVFSNISIDVEIGKINLSSGYGQLKKFTEIVVLHPVEKPRSSVQTAHQFTERDKVANGKENYVKLIYNLMNNILEKNISINEKTKTELYLKEVKENNLKKKKNFEFRAQPMFLCDCALEEKIKNCFVITSGFKIENTCGPYSIKILAEIKKVSNESKEDGSKEKSMHAYIICFYNEENKNAFCPPYVMKKLNLHAGSRIVIEQSKQYPGDSIKAINENTETVESFWSSMLSIRDNIRQTILNNFKYDYKINTLLVGETGTGKTFFLTNIINEFTNKYIYCKMINCKSLRGKKIESLHKIWNEHLKEFVCQEPSILVLDDLHALTYVDEEDNPFNRLYSDRIITLISDILIDFQKKYNITVVASATSMSQLSSIVSRYGPHLFENVTKIPEMDVNERKFMLRNIINQKIGVSGNCSVDLDLISNNTNGYTVQNLKDLVDKAVFNCLLRNETEVLNINQTDFDLAISELTPLNLRSVKSKQNFETHWDDVGGMAKPKEILTEVFSWPLQYPELLKSCPLRLQRGVLLYGAPGTGKTLLAAALANKCGLNFISVKGPEVLSKFIGASEEGVRNLFIQAQKSQPSLLFFDEFDSLASRRGHDNSGVTDRVVNQLLTQLDGVEALNNVWVLAATSRPDLLDPALLRPGRLDKLVFCAIPDKIDRLSILEVLTKNVLAENINLLEIAEKSEGYTGADLKAVLYNAQMIAIKEEKNSLQKSSKIIIKQRHLNTALSETRPSLPQAEKERYNRIYEKFQSSRKGDYRNSYSEVQTVTLA